MNKNDGEKLNRGQVSESFRPLETKPKSNKPKSPAYAAHYQVCL